MAAVEEDQYPTKVAELRSTFASEYKSNIDNKLYDERDVRRLNTEDAYTMRFIFHQQFDIKKAAAQADGSLRFRKEFEVNDLKEASFDSWMHENGALYYHNQDRDGHDILLFRVCKNKKDPTVAFKVKQFIAWWIDKSFSKHPDKQIAVLFDMTDVGLANVDVDLIKYQVSCFSTYFPGMLAYMLIYEMPWVLNAVWKLIKNILTAEQQKRVLFVKKGDIQKYIHPDQLPVHMGGQDTFVYKYIPNDASSSNSSGKGDEGNRTGPFSSEEEKTQTTKPDSPIINGHVTDEQYFSSTNPPKTTVTSSMKATSSNVTLASSASPLTTSQKSSAKSQSSPGLSANSGVRKRVTFSQDGDTHYPADEQSSTKRSSSYEDDKVVFEAASVTLRPAEHLLFRVKEATLETQDTISITNSSDGTLAFKIKTTNPESFRVRPSTGLVAPNETCEIAVYLQPGCQDNVSRDKFLIMLMKVEEGVKVSSLSDRWRNPPGDPEEYMEHRLFCQLVTVQESQQQVLLERCEEALNNLSKDPAVSETPKDVVKVVADGQIALQRRINRVFICQLLLGIALFFLAVFVIIASLTDWVPFVRKCDYSGGLHGACQAYLSHGT